MRGRRRSPWGGLLAVSSVLVWLAAAADPEGDAAAEDEELLGALDARPEELPARVPGQRSDVLEVGDANWTELVLDPTRDVLVLFYSTFDYHSGAAMPHYEAAATAFAAEAGVVFARVDIGEHDTNPETQRKYGFAGRLRGWPHFLWFPRGAKQGEEVMPSSGRTATRFVAFVNERLGFHRRVDGSLDERAGRDPALEGLIASAETLAAAADAVEQSSAEKDAREGYAKLLRRAASSGGAEWLVRERARLSRLLAAAAAPAKRDDLQRRSNRVHGIASAALPSVSFADLAGHRSPEDLWVAYRGVVYSIPQAWVAERHPGGERLLEAAGEDATAFFDGGESASGARGHAHSEAARERLRRFAVAGRLSGD